MYRKMNVISTLAILGSVFLTACARPAGDALMAPAEDQENTSMTSPDVEDQPIEIPAMEETEISSESMLDDDLPAWYTWEFEDVNSGKTFKLTDFKGKVILVETMAVWCPKCLQQQQEVARLHQLLGERDDYVSLGIDIDPNENRDTLTRYTMQNGFNWLYIVAPNNLIDAIGILYGTQYLNPPSTPMLIIDQRGEAHLLSFGIKSAEDLLNTLEPFLGEG